jgi:protocatechuate 3,4-dioxygenase beta subunit
MLSVSAALIAFAVSIAAAQPAQTAAPPAPRGTSTLRGHVFGADNGRPLRKAQVRISADDINNNRATMTDENGAYEFRELRAGRYTISASKPNYLYVAYSQQRDGRLAEPIEVLDHQTVERVDLTLARAGVVTGRILDEFGEPASEIEVALERYEYNQGQRRLYQVTRSATTNDIGEFRLYGIQSGQYYLSATWRNPNAMVFRETAGGRTAYAPLYFPGTVNAEEAQRIAVTAGQELDGLVMMLQPIRAWRVTGMASGSDGKPLTPAMIVVARSTVGFNSVTGFSVPVRFDGTFTINALAPGPYTLRAQRFGNAPGDMSEIATASISIGSEDIADLHLVAAKPSTLAGRILVDPAAAASLPIALTVAALPVNPVSMAIPFPPGRVGDDSTFEVKSNPGPTRITVGGGFSPPPPGWIVRSVRLHGIDVTDAIDVKANENIGGIDVELTNKLTTISGAVKDTRGETARGYTVIVFAQDKEKWKGNSRYRGTGHPDKDGKFTISGLPQGEYYIVAVDRVEPGQWEDPDFLESMRDKATPFSLRDAETRTIELRLTRVQ